MTSQSLSRGAQPSGNRFAILPNKINKSVRVGADEGGRGGGWRVGVGGCRIPATYFIMPVIRTTYMGVVVGGKGGGDAPRSRTWAHLHYYHRLPVFCFLIRGPSAWCFGVGSGVFPTPPPPLPPTPSTIFFLVAVLWIKKSSRPGDVGLGASAPGSVPRILSGGGLTRFFIFTIFSCVLFFFKICLRDFSITARAVRRAKVPLCVIEFYSLCVMM